MKLFFHVQHLLGIGHLKRAALLCRALGRAGFDVTLASGGRPVPGIVPAGVRLVQLPSAAAADMTFSRLVDEHGIALTEAWRRRRAQALLDAWRAARARVLVVELFPFGRRSFAFELVPLLEAARADGALAVCSVRDLLQPKPAREAQMLELFERYFDRLLVHGDPRVAPFASSFGPAARLQDRLHYTGYVVEEAPAGSAGRGEVLVSGGGGAVGERLLAAALEARPLSSLRTLRWRVLTGFHPRGKPLREESKDLVIEPARADFPALLAGCELSISQAGYNTVMETLRAGARALVVPFAGGGETEQTQRARLFAERGLLEVLEEDALSPRSLAAAAERAAARPRPARDALDMDGARRSAELLRRWAA